MLVKEVLARYHKMIPFPWTLQKIKRSGLSPSNLFVDIASELSQCEDANTPTCREVLTTIEHLKQ